MNVLRIWRLLFPLLAAVAAHAQEGSLLWSAFSTGYAVISGDSSTIQGTAGQIFVGNVADSSGALGCGFFAGFNPAITTRSLSLTGGWNMVSVPVTANDYQKSTLFPTALSPAFLYSGSYVSSTLLANGAGYWLKFSNDQMVYVAGLRREQDTITIVNGWNMVGSISDTIRVENITSIPPGLVTSPFIGYAGSYIVAGQIEPGKGYWVKVNQGGKLVFAASTIADPSTRIRIVPTSELPPAEPDGEISAPRVFSLDQNYPNPFNPSTAVRYTVPDAAAHGREALLQVTLKIYDVLGREVATLVDGMQDAGSKSVVWEAKGMTSGVYFYRLAIGRFVETKKMMLIR